jgi:hypothetical protein
MQAYVMQGHEIHAYKMQVHEMQSHEIHAYEMQASGILVFVDKMLDMNDF